MGSGPAAKAQPGAEALAVAEALPAAAAPRGTGAACAGAARACRLTRYLADTLQPCGAACLCTHSHTLCSTWCRPGGVSVLARDAEWPVHAVCCNSMSALFAPECCPSMTVLDDTNSCMSGLTCMHSHAST